MDLQELLSDSKRIPFKVNEFEYRYSNAHEVILCRCLNYSESLIIPNSIRYQENDYNVTGIESLTFSKCHKIKYIFIPSNIKYIGQYS